MRGENAFGDPQLTDLCPANPEAQFVCDRLNGGLASRGVATVVAESLHFHRLEHGFHHERYFVDLGTFGRLLLGLCFCPNCVLVAERQSIDAQRLRCEVRSELEMRGAKNR